MRYADGAAILFFELRARRRATARNRSLLAAPPRARDDWLRFARENSLEETRQLHRDGVNQTLIGQFNVGIGGCAGTFGLTVVAFFSINIALMVPAVPPTS